MVESRRTSPEWLPSSENARPSARRSASSSTHQQRAAAPRPRTSLPSAASVGRNGTSAHNPCSISLHLRWHHPKGVAQPEQAGKKQYPSHRLRRRWPNDAAAEGPVNFDVIKARNFDLPISELRQVIGWRSRSHGRGIRRWSGLPAGNVMA